MTPNSNEEHHRGNGNQMRDDDESESIFSELRLSSIPSTNFSQQDAKLPPP